MCFSSVGKIEVHPGEITTIQSREFTNRQPKDLGIIIKIYSV